MNHCILEYIKWGSFVYTLHFIKLKFGKNINIQTLSWGTQSYTSYLEIKSLKSVQYIGKAKTKTYKELGGLTVHKDKAWRNLISLQLFQTPVVSSLPNTHRLVFHACKDNI